MPLQPSVEGHYSLANHTPSPYWFGVRVKLLSLFINHRPPKNREFGLSGLTSFSSTQPPFSPDSLWMLLRMPKSTKLPILTKLERKAALHVQALLKVFANHHASGHGLSSQAWLQPHGRGVPPRVETPRRGWQAHSTAGQHGPEEVRKSVPNTERLD